MTERKYINPGSRPNQDKTQGTKDPRPRPRHKERKTQTRTQGTKDPRNERPDQDPLPTQNKRFVFVIVVVCRNCTIEHILTHVLTHILTHIFTNVFDVFVRHFMYRRRQRNATFEVASTPRHHQLKTTLRCVDLCRFVLI